MTTSSVAPPLYHSFRQTASFPRPDAETFRGPEWTDAELMNWVQYYQRERAASIEAGNDRTAGSVAYCNFRMDAMLAELARRKAQAKRFKHDPRGPRWSTAGSRQRADLVEFAHELKGRWPIDRFLIDLMLCDLQPSGRNQWTCRYVSGLHEDRIPSMTVYGDGDPHVHCYSCGYHGDVIDLTAMYFTLTTFPDAVRKLAEATRSMGEVIAS